ncbi:MAG TPA: glycosyltransferase family 39 protein [Candidatus Polarisedimenticolia bacterium]|nr:glycosyltransferase family 39 protein [Candidatus Polarisedimenticolia bacterium]
MKFSPPSRRDAAVLGIVAGVFAVSLLARLAYLVQLHRAGLGDYLRLDPLYYHDWALRIAGGDLLGAQTYEMTPLYAYALGGLFALVGHSLIWARVVQAILGALTCALVSLLGCRIFGRAEGIVAGLTLAVYGPALFHESQIMKTVLTTALATATAAIFWRSEGSHVRWLAAGGLALGVTALCQENVNVTLPFLLAWAAWRAPRGRRAAAVAAILGGFVLAVAPATLRNYAVSRELVLITSGGGEVFYTGNNEHASGKYRPPAFVRPDPFFEHQDFRAEAARRLGRPVTRRESDAYWWGEGIRFIRENPARYAALLWDKLATYFTGYERPDNYAYENFRRFVPLLAWPLPGFGLVAPFGLVGVALSARRWPSLLPILVVMGAFVLSALLFFTQSRYRMPMVPLLAMFAAHAAVRLVRAARAGPRSLLVLGVPAVALLAIAINRDPGSSVAFEAQNHGILGEMLLYAGRQDEAAIEFRAALAKLQGYPGDSTGDQHLRVLASSHFGIALALEKPAGSGGPGAGADDERIEHLRAAGAGPDADLRRDALDRLGALLSSRGDAAGSAEAYTGAADADPEDVGIRLRLAEALHKAGRPREALEAAAGSLRLPGARDPALAAAAHYGQALIYLKDLPDRARAAEHLREALRLQPWHPRAAWIRSTLSGLEPDGAMETAAEGPPR